MLSVDDIDSFISVSCEPIRSDGARGPIIVSKQVGPIVPGKLFTISLICSFLSKVVSFFF